MDFNWLLKNRKNEFFDSFLAGYYKTGTLFSEFYFYANIGKNISDNPFRLRGIELAGEYNIGSQDNINPIDFAGYFLGRITGISFIPFDLSILFNNLRKDYKNNSLENKSLK